MSDPKREHWLRDTIVGWVIYPLGDLVAQSIAGEFDWRRLVVLAFVGGIVYRFEVPRWFRLLDRFRVAEGSYRAFARPDGHLNWLGRTLGAILYFNPLWIARHMLFIRLATDPASLLVTASWIELLTLATKSFFVNLPISLAGNYVIQMRLPLQWRFLGSSIFSALLACAYALAYRYF